MHFIIKLCNVYISDYNALDFDDESFNGVENKFIFNFPIGHIDQMTLTIGNCKQLISFKHDSDTATISSYGNPIVFTTTSPHLFTLPFYVMITGFNTLDPVADKYIIDTINSERAQKATVTGASTFTLPINSTGLTPLGGLTVNIYYEDRRIIVPLIIEHE